MRGARTTDRRIRAEDDGPQWMSSFETKPTFSKSASRLATLDDILVEAFRRLPSRDDAS